MNSRQNLVDQHAIVVDPIGSVNYYFLVVIVGQIVGIVIDLDFVAVSCLFLGNVQKSVSVLDATNILFISNDRSRTCSMETKKEYFTYVTIAVVVNNQHSVVLGIGDLLLENCNWPRVAAKMQIFFG